MTQRPTANDRPDDDVSAVGKERQAGGECNHIADDDKRLWPGRVKTSIGQCHQEVEHQRWSQGDCQSFSEIGTESLGASEIPGSVEAPRQSPHGDCGSECVHDGCGGTVLAHRDDQPGDRPGNSQAWQHERPAVASLSAATSAVPAATAESGAHDETQSCRDAAIVG